MEESPTRSWLKIAAMGAAAGWLAAVILASSYVCWKRWFVVTGLAIASGVALAYYEVVLRILARAGSDSYDDDDDVV